MTLQMITILHIYETDSDARKKYLILTYYTNMESLITHPKI